MSEQITLDDLSKYLEQFSFQTQAFAQSSQADEDAKLLYDNLAQQCHYMFSYIIDYLKQ